MLKAQNRRRQNYRKKCAKITEKSAPKLQSKEVKQRQNRKWSDAKSKVKYDEWRERSKNSKIGTYNLSNPSTTLSQARRGGRGGRCRTRREFGLRGWLRLSIDHRGRWSNHRDPRSNHGHRRTNNGRNERCHCRGRGY